MKKPTLLKHLYNFLVDELISLRPEKDQILVILNDITAAHLPDHRWASLPAAPGAPSRMDANTFHLVSHAQARQQYFGIAPQSELPADVFKTLDSAFSANGFSIQHTSRVHRHASAFTAYRPDHCRAVISQPGLLSLRARKDAIKAQLREAGLFYKISAPRTGPALQY